MLDDQVGRLAHGQDIFTRDVFTEVVRQLAGEMTSSGIRHVDLRVGVLMRRWPWIGSLADAIRAFKAAMPSPEALTVSFLGAVNLSKPRDVLDAVGICLDMCPVSNTRLGAWDWTRSSPAAKAMRLGLPVTINTDDPILFSAGLAANLALSGLSPAQLERARLAGNRYGYQP